MNDEDLRKHMEWIKAMDEDSRKTFLFLSRLIPFQVKKEPDVGYLITLARIIRSGNRFLSKLSPEQRIIFDVGRNIGKLEAEQILLVKRKSLE